MWIASVFQRAESFRESTRRRREWMSVSVWRWAQLYLADGMRGKAHSVGGSSSSSSSLKSSSFSFCSSLLLKKRTWFYRSALKSPGRYTDDLVFFTQMTVWQLVRTASGFRLHAVWDNRHSVRCTLTWPTVLMHVTASEWPQCVFTTHDPTSLSFRWFWSQI